MKKIAAIYTSLFFPLLLVAQAWEILPVGSGVKPSIDVDTAGNPHVAYMLEALPGFVKLATIVNDTFVSTTVDEAYYYGPLDLMIDHRSIPHIAVHHHDFEDQVHYYPDENGVWITDRIEHPGHDGWDNSIVVDEEGHIHTSSIDPSRFGGMGVEYAYFDGQSWSVEPLISGQLMYANTTCLRLDSQNKPHITFFDDVGQQLKYATKSGLVWNIDTVDADGSAGRFSSLVMDENDYPHISYHNALAGGKGEIRYAFWNGTTWDISIVDTLDAVEISFSGARNMTALVKDENEQLHLSYGDRLVVRYATLTEEGWQIEDVVDFSSSPTILGAQTDIAVSSNGRIHITYFELTTSSPLRGEVKYATKMPIISSNEYIEVPSLKLDVFPNPIKTQCTIDYELDQLDNAYLEINSLDGKQLWSQQIQSKQGRIELNLTAFAKGIYLVSLRNGKVVQNKKLVLMAN